MAQSQEAILIRRIEKLQGEYDRIEAWLGRQHPRLKGIQRQLAALGAKLERLRGQSRGVA